MFNSAKQEQIEIQNIPVLRLIKNEDQSPKKDYFLYYNSGVFPILLVIILFLCAGVIINIGLRIQNMNYDKKIYSMNQLISSEKERTDRLNLKISELKSPTRIAAAINPEYKNNDNMDESSADTEKGKNTEAAAEGNSATGEEKPENNTNLKKLDIVYSKTANDAVISELETDKNNNESFKGASLVLMVENIKDVLMVVSEGILTFFIP
ncbi:hypothetical protein LLG07_06870 [bacterium]|nr:hypothetical protein [bacterium]